MMGERPKLKEVALPVDTVKELADLIPKPDNQYHYRVSGDWQENREVYRVAEGDGVFSDYSFPEKSDMSKVQFATRKTYTKELDMWGKLKEKNVEFDRKSGMWKKLNFFQEIKHAFHKETNIPSQVVTEVVDGKDVSVLHTLEQKRPVGNNVKEAMLATVQDAKVELGLKYKYAEYKLSQLQEMNARLQDTLASVRREAAVWQQEFYRVQGEQSRTSFEAERRHTMEAQNRMKNETRMTEQKIADAKQKAANTKLDREYQDWVTHHPDKAYYENSGNPMPSKADYVAMKDRQAAAQKAAQEAVERGLAKDSS